MKRNVLQIHRSIFLVLIVVLLISCNTPMKPNPFWDEKSNPTTIAQLVANELLSREGLMLYQTDFLNTLHYAEACAAVGAIRLSEKLNDPNLLTNIAARYSGILTHFDTLPANHVDANVVGIIPLLLFNHNHDERYMEMGISMADKQWENTSNDSITNHARYWIDDLYMIAILQLEVYRITGNEDYLNRTALTFSSYLDSLQKPNGLFHHGPVAPFYWGRGNGWVAAALAEMIDVLPENNPYYEKIIGGYKKMMQALLEYQSTDGMWRQLIDNEASWHESSGTAMFGYALKVGVDKGLLKGVEYENAYKKAWLALAERVNEDGKLTGICIGTGQSLDVQYYLDRPVTTGDLHGQAPIMWFANRLLEPISRSNP